VKSPPWMKISPFCFSYTNFKRSSLLPWVSDAAIIISFLFSAFISAFVIKEFNRAYNEIQFNLSSEVRFNTKK
jgi:hypothetical protein